MIGHLVDEPLFSSTYLLDFVYVIMIIIYDHTQNKAHQGGMEVEGVGGGGGG